MRGSRVFRWACVLAVLLLLGPATGISLAQEKKFIAPVSGEVDRPFDAPADRFSKGHRGIDYGVPSGTPVRASGEGTVSFAGRVAEGLYVTVEHGNGLETTYSFLSQVDVSTGDRVSQGQVIALSGAGHPGGPSALHFGAKLDDNYIDPGLLLSGFTDISELIQLNRMAPGSGSESARFASGHANFSNFEPQAPTAVGVAANPDIEPGKPAVGSVRIGGSSSPEVQAAPSMVTAGAVTTGVSTLPDWTLDSIREPTAVRIPETAIWRELPEEARADLLTENRSELQDYAGLSSAERDAINRDLLEKRYQELLRERDSEAGRRSMQRDRWWTVVRGLTSPVSVLSKFDRETTLDRKIRSAKALLNQLEKSDAAGTPAYLLEFDVDFANGDGRAVVALGDPDTADHIGVLVPGINNAVGSIGGPLDDMRALRSATADLDKRVAENTSTIVWMGYDNPNGFHDAPNRAEAIDAAPFLKRFVNGLRTRHVGGPSAPHITVFGHSYGSAVTGIAALDGMQADDIVFFGSPGVGRFAVDASDFLQKRVWVAIAKGDLIQLAAGTLGSDPSLSGFGAREIPLSSFQRGHSSYFALQSLGLENFARILIGQKVKSG